MLQTDTDRPILKQAITKTDFRHVLACGFHNISAACTKNIFSLEHVSIVSGWSSSAMVLSIDKTSKRPLRWSNDALALSWEPNWFDVSSRRTSSSPKLYSLMMPSAKYKLAPSQSFSYFFIAFRDASPTLNSTAELVSSATALVTAFRKGKTNKSLNVTSPTSISCLHE